MWVWLKGNEIGGKKKGNVNFFFKLDSILFFFNYKRRIYFKFIYVYIGNLLVII